MSRAVDFIEKVAPDHAYSGGRCHIYALALNKALGYKIQALWDLEPEYEHGEPDETPVLVHMYNVKPDGSFVDITGTITKDDIENNYGDYPNDPDYIDHIPKGVLGLIDHGILDPPYSGEIEGLVKKIKEEG